MILGSHYFLKIRKIREKTWTIWLEQISSLVYKWQVLKIWQCKNKWILLNLETDSYKNISRQQLDSIYTALSPPKPTPRPK